MLEPIEVRALPGYKLHIRYSDGVTGEVDLSHLVGKGVFSLWSEPGEFEKVHLAPGGGIAWGQDVDLCPDSLYMAITAKSTQEVFSSLLSHQEKRDHMLIGTEPRIKTVSLEDSLIRFDLVDGRTVSVPLAWSWRLAEATPKQRANFEIIGDGQGVHWPDIDEDLSAQGMLTGVPAVAPNSGMR